MRILNLGSCCIDHVYHVPHFVNPGETLPCNNYEIHPGGKGLNQSLAIARAGGNVQHAGKLGNDGTWLKSLLNDAGVDTSLLMVVDEPSGHANIQVNQSGENAIVLFGGTNRMISEEEVSSVIDSCEAGDFLILQNEISSLQLAMTLGAEKGMRMIFNAAPMTADVKALPISDLEVLIINEVEGEQLTGSSKPEAILDKLRATYPSVNIVLTLGSEGAIYEGQSGRYIAASPQVAAVDTTGAGDTFTGYFIAEYSAGAEPQRAMEIACSAAAISVTRPGAASSIPHREELS